MSTAKTKQNIKFPAFNNLDDKIAKNPVTLNTKETSNKLQPISSNDLNIGEGLNGFFCEGGGVKGIQQAVICTILEQITGKPFYLLVDLVGGTSAGALNMAILTIPKEKGSLEPLFAASESIDLFTEMAQVIFPQSTFKQTMNNIKTFNGLLGNKYNNEALKKLLEKYCGDLTLADTIVPIFIPVYDLYHKELVVLSTLKARESPEHNYRLVDVLLGTTAAPGYLPPVKVTNISGMKDSVWIDGGLGKNSPTLAVYLELLAAGYKINSMNYVSSDDPYVKGYSAFMYGGGKLDILKNGVQSMLLSSQQRWEENIIERILVDKYCKIEVPLSDQSNTKLDDSSTANLQSLIADTEDYIRTEGNLWLKGIVDNLTASYDRKHPENKINANLELYKELFNTLPPNATKEIDEGYGREEDLSSSEEELSYDLPNIGVNAKSTADVIPQSSEPSALPAHPPSDINAGARPIAASSYQKEQADSIVPSKDMVEPLSLRANKHPIPPPDEGYDSGVEENDPEGELLDELLGKPTPKRDEMLLDGVDPVNEDYSA